MSKKCFYILGVSLLGPTGPAQLSVLNFVSVCIKWLAVFLLLLGGVPVHHTPAFCQVAPTYLLVHPFKILTMETGSVRLEFCLFDFCPNNYPISHLGQESPLPVETRNLMGLKSSRVIVKILG